MLKKKQEELTMKILFLLGEDVITASGPNVGDGEDNELPPVWIE